MSQYHTQCQPLSSNTSMHGRRPSIRSMGQCSELLGKRLAICQNDQRTLACLFGGVKLEEGHCVLFDFKRFLDDCRVC